jgi:hypothetical protein
MGTGGGGRLCTSQIYSILGEAYFIFLTGGIWGIPLICTSSRPRGREPCDDLYIVSKNVYMQYLVFNSETNIKASY